MLSEMKFFLPLTIEVDLVPRAIHSSFEASDRFQLPSVDVFVRENSEPRLLKSLSKGFKSPTSGAMVGRHAAMMDAPASMRAHKVFALETSIKC